MLRSAGSVLSLALFFFGRVMGEGVTPLARALSLSLLLACLLGVWAKGPRTPHPALSRYA